MTIFSSFFLAMFSGVVWADFSAISIANTYIIDDKSAVNGDIIVNTSDGLRRATLSYDNSMLGVLTSDPVAVFKAASGPEKPVATGGVVIVNVTNRNGEIKKGDFITSSETPGKGMKATSPGYVLGMALGEPDPASASADYDQVEVALRIEYAELNSPQSFKRLFDLFGRGLFQNVGDPDKFGQLLRFIAAGLAILIALILALLIFARSIPKAIEAIGRNPLAKNAIYLSLAFTAILIIITVLIGIGGAIVILRI